MSEVSVKHCYTLLPGGAGPVSRAPTPFAIHRCTALKAHALKAGLRNIRIDHLASPVSWTEPEFKGVFRLRDNYSTPPNRAACHAGDSDYLPVGLWRSYELPAGMHPEPDFIRTSGDNYIRIDQVDLFIEGHPSDPSSSSAPQPNPDEVGQVEDAAKRLYTLK